MAYQKAWLNKALISVAVSGGAEVVFHSNTKDIDITMPDRDIAVENNTNGGQLVSYNPDGTWEVKFSGWANDDIDMDAIYADQTAATSVVNSFAQSRTPVRVVIMWTTDTSASSATASTSASSDTRRLIFTKGYVTAYPQKYSSSDGKLMYDLTFKGPAHLSTGTGTITRQKADAATLAALSAYTETDI